VLIRRCAWHGRGRRIALLGIAAWRPVWPVRYTDGICGPCLDRTFGRRSGGTRVSVEVLRALLSLVACAALALLALIVAP